jgi:cell division protein FtsB
MMAVRQRNDPTRLLWRRLGLLVLLGLVCFAAWGVWGAWNKDQTSAALNQESQAALATLSAQQTQLRQNITELQSTRGKEAALRQEYAVGEQGENMIVIVNSTSTPPPPPPSLFDKLKSAFSWW